MLTPPLLTLAAICLRFFFMLLLPPAAAMRVKIHKAVVDDERDDADDMLCARERKDARDARRVSASYATCC